MNDNPNLSGGEFMLLQDESRVAAKHVYGSLERVKKVQLNLRALTSHTLTAMENERQAR